MKVLVTGLSGFVGMHCALAALRAGHDVRGTLRSPERFAKIRAALSRALGEDVSARLEFVRADLAEDAGWTEAMDGVTYVLHVASPILKGPPEHESDMIVPARQGTLRVLDAAARAPGVRRVVMTASIASIIYGHRRDGSEVYDETYWSILTREIGAYEWSKTIAERAAWRFVKSLPVERNLELVTIHPGLILGPVLDDTWAVSGETIKQLLNRELPAVPDVVFACVDVRDVADAHLRAMVTPAAAGERFLCAGDQVSLVTIAKITARHFGPRGYKVPTLRLPNPLMRIVGLFDRPASLLVQELGKTMDLDTSKIRRVLGFQPRSIEEMVVSMGESLIEHGVVKRPARSS